MRIATLLPLLLTVSTVTPAFAQAVPGYVPPVTVTKAPDYADDTRGVFVPTHEQYRMKTPAEFSQASDQVRYAQAAPQGQSDAYEQEMSRIAGSGGEDLDSAMDRIAGGGTTAPAPQQQMPMQPQQGMTPSYGGGYAPQQQPMMSNAPVIPTPMAPVAQGGERGVEMAVGQSRGPVLDMNNSLVRLREDRISIRRAVRRMLDQIGGSDWTISWDMSEPNRPLPDMEISIDANEPFMNVMNALLARVQTRSGQPLRVVRYDESKRLLITDRVDYTKNKDVVSPIGIGATTDPVVTEQVLKESMVSLHYDEVPLVDALESLVNQAGKGQWRLRIYAGMDQVLKPAHIEEPFSIAMERLLQLFNLKYEIFPGGKLVVVTQNNRFGFSGVK